MKKIIFGSLAIALFLLVGFTTYSDSINEKPNKVVNDIGKIHIKFHGGNLCWLSGSACEGEITIEWRTAPPSDSNVIAPEGFQLMTMETSLYVKSSRNFAERTFNSDETSDGSTIYIPSQKGLYSKKSDAFVLYAKRIKK